MAQSFPADDYFPKFKDILWIYMIYVNPQKGSKRLSEKGQKPGSGEKQHHLCKNKFFISVWIMNRNTLLWTTTKMTNFSLLCLWVNQIFQQSKKHKIHRKVQNDNAPQEGSMDWSSALDPCNSTVLNTTSESQEAITRDRAQKGSSHPPHHQLSNTVTGNAKVKV